MSETVKQMRDKLYDQLHDRVVRAQAGLEDALSSARANGLTVNIYRTQIKTHYFQRDKAVTFKVTELEVKP